jgi:hypothetical protein
MKRHFHLGYDGLRLSLRQLTPSPRFDLYPLGLGIQIVDAVESEDLIQPEIGPGVIRRRGVPLGRTPAGEHNPIGIRLTAQPLVMPHKSGCNVKRAGRIYAFGLARNLGDVGFKPNDDGVFLGFRELDLV